MVYVLRLFKLMYCERLNTEKKNRKVWIWKNEFEDLSTHSK